MCAFLAPRIGARSPPIAQSSTGPCGCLPPLTLSQRGYRRRWPVPLSRAVVCCGAPPESSWPAAWARGRGCTRLQRQAYGGSSESSWGRQARGGSSERSLQGQARGGSKRSLGSAQSRWCAASERACRAGEWVGTVLWRAARCTQHIRCMLHELCDGNSSPARAAAPHSGLSCKWHSPIARIVHCGAAIRAQGCVRKPNVGERSALGSQTGLRASTCHASISVRHPKKASRWHRKSAANVRTAICRSHQTLLVA